jgi:hypothetical protein
MQEKDKGLDPLLVPNKFKTNLHGDSKAFSSRLEAITYNKGINVQRNLKSPIKRRTADGMSTSTKSPSSFSSGLATIDLPQPIVSGVKQIMKIKSHVARKAVTSEGRESQRSDLEALSIIFSRYVSSSLLCT